MPSLVIPEPMGPRCMARWHCELCGSMTPPLVGSLIAGARHRCRTCGRTVCDNCSIVPLKGVRTCRTCYLQGDQTKSASLPQEKYIFLLRHAQSTWNQNVDLVKTFRRCSLQGLSVKDVVSRAALLMAREVWHKDHPISEEGVRQTEELRRKIIAAQRSAQYSSSDDVQTQASSSSNSRAGPQSCPGCSQREQERVRRYYDTFLSRKQQIYCSPLLRALQTAHLVLREEDGWGSIKLLKDARERYRFLFERDCVGTDVGTQIVDRAMHMGHELPGLQYRVDAADCAQKWWSDEPETEAEVEARLKTLWSRLLEEDGDDSCVLVTHSNLIKALIMRFGGVDEDDVFAGGSCHLHGHRPGEAESPLLPVRTDDGSAILHSIACASRALKVSQDNEDDPFVDISLRQDGSEPDSETAAAWQVVDGGSEALRRLKVERLQNCGVLGLRCVLETPQKELYPEVDGWVNIDSPIPIAAGQCVAEPRWVAKDALLMFDSVLVK